MKTKPTLVLGMINDAGIAKILADCLRFHGFEVIDFSLDSLTFTYPNFLSRIKTQWKKMCGNKHAKKELMVELKRQQIREQLAKYDHFDYALFIRSDIYPQSFIQEIKQKSTLTVNYQWDGIERFGDVLMQIALFDRFYVFDPDDLARYPDKLLPATSFYFDHFTDELPLNDAIYYLGAHRADRKNAIIQFCQYAEKHDIPLNFQIACPNHPEAKNEYSVSNVHFHQGITYQENLQHARSCGILADFVISTHKGLSLRTFEAIGYRKKLITTNTEVAKYDFYHPNNIFIWNGQDLDGLTEFLKLPYIELDQHIYEKYSFANWIRYILQIEPYQAFRLPENN